jgi:tRNA (guanine-N7-)-methyltransferase
MPRPAMSTPATPPSHPPQTAPSAPQAPLKREEPDPRRYQELAPAAPDGPIDLSLLWDEAAHADAELELEVGFGRGMFLLERAAAAPGSRILGIEIKRKWAYLVAERAKKLGLTNVRVFGADARDVMARLAPDRRLARMFMHFPDPWWKKRHAKRRLNGPGMFDPAARLLRPTGQLFIQTDVEDRAAGFLDDLREHGGFDIPPEGYVLDNPFQARSNREKRAITDGLPIYRILVTRRA